MFWSLCYGWYRTKELNVYCPIRGNNNEENIKPPNHRLDVYATGMVRDFSMSTTGGKKGQTWTDGNPNRRCLIKVSRIFMGEEKMLPEKQKKAYKTFYDSARNNEYFDEKTTILLHLASAFAIGCYP